MSENQYIAIPRFDDKVLVTVFKDLAAQYSVPHFKGTAVGLINLGIYNLSADTNPTWDALVSSNSSLLLTLSLTINNLHITFYRGGRPENSQKSAVFDEIRLQVPDQFIGTEVEERIKVIATLSKKLKAFEPGRTVKGTSSEDYRQMEAIHLSTLERLEKLSEEVIQKAAESRQRIEEQYQEKAIRYEEDIALKKAALEKQHKESLILLEQKEAELNEKLKAIDDRNNTHARREIRNKMLDDVRNRIKDFGVSNVTRRTRMPVAKAFFITLLILCLLIASTGAEIYAFQNSTLFGFATDLTAKATQAGVSFKSDLTPLYLLWARFTFLSIGLIATLIYYIKWQNRWADQHATTEFQLQQFYIDVNRANWVIESGLEWQKETGSTMPEKVVASITKNLFNSASEPENVLHPADELASALIGRASKVKLRSGDNEMEFDKPGKTMTKAVKVDSE